MRWCWCWCWCTHLNNNSASRSRNRTEENYVPAQSSSPSSRQTLPTPATSQGYSASRITSHRPKWQFCAYMDTIRTVLLLFFLLFIVKISFSHGSFRHRFTAAFSGVRHFDWRANASFRVTPAMRISIVFSLLLGVLLGIGVGLLSGLEPAVVIGVSASMALGCVFVMSFAVLHGVSVLRAVSFGFFVSACLPVGFGVGFGIGVLAGVFLGLEEPDDVREKTTEFVRNFGEFAKVIVSFALDIL